LAGIPAAGNFFRLQGDRKSPAFYDGCHARKRGNVNLPEIALRYLLLGAGLQGTAIAFDLLRHAPGTEKLVVVDAVQAKLWDLTERMQDGRLETVCADVRDRDILAPLMAAADVVVSAVNFWLNASLAGCAVENGTHFLDLGGNSDIVAREFELNQRALAQGVCIIPDCGLAPGLVGILGAWLVDGLARAESLRLRVGGLPTEPRPPLNYKTVFSVQGLINKYIEPAVILREGRVKTVPALSELETLNFPPPYGELEAFQTGGGTSTLPRTLAGKVANLDYKTIRYRGHCAQIRLLVELGLCDAVPRNFPDGKVAPRQMLARLLEEKLDLSGGDVVLLLAEAEGWTDPERAVRKTVRIIAPPDKDHDLSAMMRMTGFPAAIIAWMLATGEIQSPGARCQELVVPGGRMMEELRRRKVAIEVMTREPGEAP
jgi:lysine 6-dehydrogenase